MPCGTSASIASTVQGSAEVGPPVKIYPKYGPPILKRRVLVGWNHQNDTPDGLKSGKLWGWSTAGNHFQVYDENFNRSPLANDMKHCGVANFTMVRMFHPYWIHLDRPPRDKHSNDKERCRYRYHQRIRQWRIDHGEDVENDPENDFQPGGNNGHNNRGQYQNQKRGRARRRGQVRSSRGGRERRTKGGNNQPLQTTTDETQLTGTTATNPVDLDDDDDVDLSPRGEDQVDLRSPRASGILDFNTSNSQSHRAMSSSLPLIKKEQQNRGSMFLTRSPSDFQQATAGRYAPAEASESRLSTASVEPIDRPYQTPESLPLGPIVDIESLQAHLTNGINAFNREETTSLPRGDGGDANGSEEDGIHANEVNDVFNDEGMIKQGALSGNVVKQEQMARFERLSMSGGTKDNAIVIEDE